MSLENAILIINLRGIIGGAEKRYINLYNYIAQKRDDYCLIINDTLYRNYKINKILTTDKNVFILRLNTKKSLNFYKNKVTGRFITQKKGKKSKIRLLLGGHKYFLSLMIKWFSFLFQLIRIIRQNKISIVYAVCFGGIWVWPLKRLYNFKLIYSYNDTGTSQLNKKYLHFFDSEYWVLKHCDKIDFLSKGIVGRLEKIIGQINPTRISITPNSFINYDNYYPEYPKNNSVVFMCRLVSIKNPILFLQAIKLLRVRKQDSQKIQFYILGEGPLESEIIDFIQKNNLRNVHSEGIIYEPWKYLRKSKVFISIMEYENYPSQSLLEAMACENAIIASDVGETRRLVTENEGILVNLNAEEIANAIYELFSSPELMIRLARNARRKAIENHNIEKFSDYFFAINEK